jgi:predicted Zn finger-like uncharacterized protein
MPELIQCPNCKRKLRVPDQLMGKKVKCPSCSTAFTAAAVEEDLPTAPLIEEEKAPQPAPRRKPPPPPPEEQVREKSSTPRRRPAAPPPADDDDALDDDAEEEERPRRRRQPIDEDEGEEEEERPRRKRSARADWARVRNGITFVLIAICIVIGAGIIAGVGTAIIGMGAAAAMAPSAAGRPTAAPVVAAGTGFLALIGFTALLNLAAQVLTLVGYIFCMAAPQKHNARTLAITTVGFAAGSLAMGLLGGILAISSGMGVAGLNMGMVGSGPVWILSLISNALSLGKYFTFLLFIMAIARCIRDYALEKSAKTLTILSGVGLVGAVIWFVLSIAFVGMAAASAMSHAPGTSPSAAANTGALAMLACSCGMAILGIVIFVWYIIVLVQARGALAYAAGR